MNQNRSPLKFLAAIVALSILAGLYARYVEDGQITLTVFGIGMALFGIWWCFSRLNDLEAVVNPLEKTVAQWENAPVYKFKITVVPNWRVIAEFIAAQENTTAGAVIGETNRQRDLGEIGPLPQSCTFRILHDGRSGLEDTWFEGEPGNAPFGNGGRSGTFVDGARVDCCVAPFAIRLMIPSMQPRLVISPDCISFDQKPIGQIPVEAIRRLLVEVSRRRGGGEHFAFKTFPPKIQDMFDKGSVTYDLSQWRDEDRPEAHFADDPNYPWTGWAKRCGIAWFARSVTSHCFTCPAYKVYVWLQPCRPSETSDYATSLGIGEAGLAEKQ